MPRLFFSRVPDMNHRTLFWWDVMKASDGVQSLQLPFLTANPQQWLPDSVADDHYAFAVSGDINPTGAAPR
jgi:hypothetical protein